MLISLFSLICQLATTDGPTITSFLSFPKRACGEVGLPMQLFMRARTFPAKKKRLRLNVIFNKNNSGRERVWFRLMSLQVHNLSTSDNVTTEKTRIRGTREHL